MFFFVLGFNVSLTLFQSCCDGTCMRQVIMLPHWNAPVADNFLVETVYQMCCVFCFWVKRLFNIISVILRWYLHETSYSAAILERSCRRQLTGAPTQSHYKLTPDRPAIFPSTHLLMPSVNKGAACVIFQRLLECRG